MELLYKLKDRYRFKILEDSSQAHGTEYAPDKKVGSCDKTDISAFEFGEGSFDKGFYFFIPVESFFDKYSKGSVGLGLRPLTRDGAASLKHTHTLYGVTEQGQFININRDWDDLYD